jgi:hypothetical protein
LIIDERDKHDRPEILHLKCLSQLDSTRLSSSSSNISQESSSEQMSGAECPLISGQKHNAILQEQHMLMEEENRSTSYDNVASALEMLQGEGEVCYAKPLAAQGKKINLAAAGCVYFSILTRNPVLVYLVY